MITKFASADKLRAGESTGGAVSLKGDHEKAEPKSPGERNKKLIPAGIEYLHAEKGGWR